VTANSLRIISPVDNFAEAGELIEAGADELYGGCLPREWHDYGLSASLNQRTFAGAQLASEDELAQVVRLAHAHQRTFSLTLNAPFYSDEQLPMIDAFVERAVAMGLDGLILADFGLLRHLRSRYPQVEFHASTLAHLSNAGAVRFAAQQGVQRVVLPRHLSVADMTAIIAAAPQVRCDAFLLVGKCPNSEGLCSFHHASPDKLWPCEIPYEISTLQVDTSPALERAMVRQDGWSKTDRRHGCGLCAIPQLRRAGVYGVKLVGRGAPAAQKVRNILLTREFLTLAEETTGFSEYRRRAMVAHHQRFGAACHQNVCYYPEYLNGGVE
jgi:putative protease